MTRVGAIGLGSEADVDARGLVTPRPGGWSIDWCIGADDRWHIASREAGVRQRLVDNAPVVETAMRVPSGDAVQRVYAVPSDGGLVVVEVENRSPTPFAVGLAVRGATRVCVVDNAVLVKGRVGLVFPKRPTEIDGSEVGGDEGPVLAFPLAHTAVLRVAIPLRPGRRAPRFTAPLPTSDEVARGWAAQTRRGMRLELPEGRLRDEVESNRRALLLHHDAGEDVRDALARYGFEKEAADRPRWRRARTPESRAAADFLLEARDRLVREEGDGLVLCPALPAEWAGQGIEVHDAPTRFGTLSYALRWHGERPALLWELDRREAQRPVRLRAPALDPAWSTTETKGEALLSGPVPV